MIEEIMHEINIDNIIIMIINENGFYKIEFQNIIYAFNMKVNLLFIIIFYDLEYEIFMKLEKEMNIIKNDIIIEKMIKYENIFRLQIIINFNIYSIIKIESKSELLNI
jgi:hypothetical protein